MCGIIAVVRRRSSRRPPAAGDLSGHLDAAAGALGGSGWPGLGGLERAADAIAAVDAALRGVPGVQALAGDRALAQMLGERVGGIEARVHEIEQGLDQSDLRAEESDVEAVNAAIVRLKDACWAVLRDRLRTAEEVLALAGADAGLAALDAFTSVQVALSGIDRLEVRGRDSAGIHVLVVGHGLDLSSAEVQPLLAARTRDPLFTSMAVRTPEGHLSFVYKAAAEIGELGDNVRALRAAIASDELLRLALVADTAEAVVLGHTRWASVGIISPANAHPLNDEEEDGEHGPYVTAALNGDVDNYLDLRAGEHLRIPAEITTDAKVIPILVSRRLAAGFDVPDAFRHTVRSFEGSVAIAAHTVAAPNQLLLALRGSGQALYVGLAEDEYIVASEPYGVVEETSCYLRMDGETTGGQLVVLDGTQAGSREGVRRISYDGDDMPVQADELHTAEITTRDIDRAGFPHFLLKEVSEAPRSFRKTLRGKIAEAGGRLRVELPEETFPEAVRRRLAEGAIRRILVVGQGTAAVAGQSMAAALAADFAAAGSDVTAQALPATELSGFGLRDDMSDTLVVAISQSGTTTDTNRTVDLVRARGAAVLGIVNRRNSDLVEKSEGVLYTSDGRDVEMSVASTKAFYAQQAAGFLLALAIGRAVGTTDPDREHEILAALRALPASMERVLGQRDDIALAASRHAPGRRYWAVVGNGANRVAAAEIRIKLSELCYKSIACDATEDKKHIDLSSEPLIVVCATGLDHATAGDVAKEVAIYRAHKAAPIVIATEGTAFPAALEVIEVPAVHPSVAFVLATMVGHLFGYEAALAIDAQARPLREVRAAVEAAASSSTKSDDVLGRLAPLAQAAAESFFRGLRAGAYNGHLEAGTAVRVASLLRYATGTLPIDAYEVEYGKIGTPAAIIEDLTDALTHGIEELTRPVDAIKHQAKTVTVGISRSEDELLRVPLVAETLATGASRDAIGYRGLRTLAELDPAVVEVAGYTRYRIEGGVADRTATIHVVDRGGVSLEIPSRTDRDPLLKGTKHRASEEREVTVAKGARDGRTVILVPETKDNQVVGLTLLHTRFAENLTPDRMKKVLRGYRTRYAALADAVTETEPAFDEALLGEIPVVDLLTQPVHLLAERWR